MNLSINQQDYFNQNNYFQNTSFQAIKLKPVFNKSEKEIADIISLSKEELKKESNIKIEDRICDIVGKCLGDKYLFQVVCRGKSSALWLAIHRDYTKALNVIENILKAKESQGKTCDEIVDSMITELKPQRLETANVTDIITGKITPEDEIINKIMMMPRDTAEEQDIFMKYCITLKLTPKIIEAINNKLKSS